MFLTSEKLLDRFQKRLAEAERIYLASAWATTGSALDCLVRWAEDGSKSLQSMIGIHGNATDPEALRQLAKYGELRIAERTGGMFHPKVYIFEAENARTLWLGSANFTTGGFESNQEAVLEVTNRSDFEAALKWFSRQWKQLALATRLRIEEYESQWKQNPPKTSLASLCQGVPRESYGGGRRNPTKTRPISKPRLPLQPVEGVRETRKAVEKLFKALKSSARRSKRTIETPSGKSPEMQTYWHDFGEVEIWCSFNLPAENDGKKTYWNCLGTGDSQNRKTLLVPVIQLNPPPKGGISKSNGAVFLRDVDGDIYVGHTGAIQIQNRGNYSHPGAFG